MINRQVYISNANSMAIKWYHTISGKNRPLYRVTTSNYLINRSSDFEISTSKLFLQISDQAESAGSECKGNS